MTFHDGNFFQDFPLLWKNCKLLEKAPIRYSLVRNLACLGPKQMAKNPSGAIQKMRRVLEGMVSAKHLKEDTCEDILLQFKEFQNCSVPESLVEFGELNPAEARLDTTLHKHLFGKPAYRVLWKVLSMLLLLSHGQASVQRGFSVNKQVEVENLQEQSFVVQRLVCNYIRSIGSIGNLSVDKKLVVGAASARNRYHAYLEEQRQRKTSEEARHKCKAVTDVFDELKNKKKRVEMDADALQASADSLADKAESQWEPDTNCQEQ